MKRKTPSQVIVGIIGYVPDERDVVAKKLALYLGATEVYAEGAYSAEEEVLAIVAAGGNAVIVNSDFVNARRRNILIRKAKPSGARVVFVLVCMDVRPPRADPPVEEQDENFLPEVKDRETVRSKTSKLFLKNQLLMRRLRQHYRWDREHGGWKLRQFPYLLATIDIARPSWQTEAAKVAIELGATLHIRPSRT